MASTQSGDATSKSAAKKKRNKSNKKKANGSTAAPSPITETNGTTAADVDDEEEADEGVDSPRVGGSHLEQYAAAWHAHDMQKGSIPNHLRDEDTLHMPSSPPEPGSPIETNEPPAINGAQQSPQQAMQLEDDTRREEEEEDELKEAEEQVGREVLGQQRQMEPEEDSDTAEKLDALQRERDELREEVVRLREGLESLTTQRTQHENEIEGVKAELEQSRQHGSELEGLRAELERSRQQGSELESVRAELEASRQRNSELEDSKADLETSRQQDSELEAVRAELEESKEAKEHAEAQYRSLLGKVNTIRSQLGERLKQDAEELELARTRIEGLEASNASASSENERLQKTVASLNSRLEAQEQEVEGLRSRTNLSTSNWVKERNDLVSREAYIREEYEVARQAMQDWEILATEERARREALEERLADAEEQISGSREAYERVRGEAEMQGSTVDGLQRALKELQEERKRELRELVSQSEAQLASLKSQVAGAESAAEELRQQLEAARKEIERAAPFEKEVREKNLLIGKLRHEAVILNDHLTKALRFLKRGKPEDNVDRQLVTNHFLHFLALDRSDPKKFQILQLIAALLGWDEGQREQAGLLRTGASGAAGYGSLKLPMSPFRRTPSTPTLSSDFVPESPGGASRESLAELWSDFLEREAEAGGGSRRPSVAQSGRSGSMASGLTSPLSGPGERHASPESRRGESSGGK